MQSEIAVKLSRFSYHFLKCRSFPQHDIVTMIHRLCDCPNIGLQLEYKLKYKKRIYTYVMEEIQTACRA